MDHHIGRGRTDKRLGGEGVRRSEDNGRRVADPRLRSILAAVAAATAAARIARRVKKCTSPSGISCRVNEVGAGKIGDCRVVGMFSCKFEAVKAEGGGKGGDVSADEGASVDARADEDAGEDASADDDESADKDARADASADEDTGAGIGASSGLREDRCGESGASLLSSGFLTSSSVLATAAVLRLRSRSKVTNVFLLRR